eukprot:m.350872 g.350872  ORF g.350872 m.350872 type:complete len:266 (-) comp20694_c0_seq1:716-1513(-)
MSPTTTYAKVSAAAFYAISSILIMAVNKYTLTVYRFPSSSFLAFAQMIVTIILLRAAKAAGLVTFPHFSLATCKKVFPLPLIYLGNIVTGLTGTKMLSLPMFSVLRRFSILMTMIGEIYLLGNKYTDKVKLSVFLMLFGAIVAASDDLAFNFMGYCWVFASNFFTAANGVILKQKLDSKELGSFGLMFYNCIVSLPVILVVLYMEDAYEKVPPATRVSPRISGCSRFELICYLDTMESNLHYKMLIPTSMKFSGFWLCLTGAHRN